MKTQKIRADNLNAGDLFLRSKSTTAYGVIGFRRDEKYRLNILAKTYEEMPQAITVPANEVVRKLDVQELVNSYPNKIR